MVFLLNSAKSLQDLTWGSPVHARHDIIRSDHRKRFSRSSALSIYPRPFASLSRSSALRPSLNMRPLSPSVDDSHHKQGPAIKSDSRTLLDRAHPPLAPLLSLILSSWRGGSESGIPEITTYGKQYWPTPFLPSNRTSSSCTQNTRPC